MTKTVELPTLSKMEPIPTKEKEIKTLVIGAGLVGRMVAKMFPGGATILEASKHLPRNEKHGTHYLWEDVPVFDTTKVTIFTTVDGRHPEEAPERIRRYKVKVGKKKETDQDWGLQFRFKSIGHVITKDAHPYDIRLDSPVLKVDPVQKLVYVKGEIVHYDRLISTIPLFKTLEIAGLSHKFPSESGFRYLPIYVRTKEVHNNFEEMITVDYVSDPAIPFYRITEMAYKKHYESLKGLKGYDTCLFPGKILPFNYSQDAVDYLASFGIQCFGRYGTWNPNELVHETYRKVETWIKTL